MPLMLCPNCNTSMSAVNRQGVEFDMCPTCRGVWLDRGELERLVAAVPAPAAHPDNFGLARAEPRERRRGYDDDDDDDRRRRRKRFDIFDIFD